MLVVPAMTPTVQASFLEGIQPLMSMIQAAGVIVFLLGAILYLCILRRDRAEAVGRSRQGSGGKQQTDGVRKRPASASCNALSPRTADKRLLVSEVKGSVT